MPRRPDYYDDEDDWYDSDYEEFPEYYDDYVTEEEEDLRRRQDLARRWTPDWVPAPTQAPPVGARGAGRFARTPPAARDSQDVSARQNVDPDPGGEGEKTREDYEQGDPAELTPEQHLAYQLFMLENAGDAHLASEELGFDTRQAQAQAPGENGTPGALVTQYYLGTKEDDKTVAGGGRPASDLAAALIIDRDRESWERTLRAAAADAGVTYHLSDLEGVIRNFSYGVNRGRDPQEMIDTQLAVYGLRAASGGERGEGGYSTDWSDLDPSRLEGGDPSAAYAIELRRLQKLQDAEPRGSAAWNRIQTEIAAMHGGAYDQRVADEEARRRAAETGGGPLPPGGAGGAPPSPYGGAPYGGAPYGGAPYGASPYGGAPGVQSLMGPWTGYAPPTPMMGAQTWDPYAAPAPYVPPSAYEPGAYQAPTYQAAAPFTAPTVDQMTVDPGYQFRLQQGQEALERSGAARGVTNTGGTLKNILDYGQQAASQEYGNVYNRAAGAWGMNEAARQAAFGLNAPQQFQAWGATEAGRLGAYQMTEADRAAAYAQNEANRRAAAQFNQTGYQQAWQTEAQRRQQDYTNRYRQWTDQYNQWRQQGQDRFNEQWMLANA